MSRISKVYADQFRNQLLRVRARKIEKGVSALVARAEALRAKESIPLVDAFARVELQLSRRTALRLKQPVPSDQSFLCDAGLGGLARWLRAAGYKSLWTPDITDNALLSQAQRTSAILLTTDSMLMERRLIRKGTVPAFWLPPALGTRAHLNQVFRQFGLAMRESRCMACGGELKSVPKDELHEQIPPKTYRWLNEYFVCIDCGKLFWRGTHWQRIRRELQLAFQADSH